MLETPGVHRRGSGVGAVWAAWGLRHCVGAGSSWEQLQDVLSIAPVVVLVNELVFNLIDVLGLVLGYVFSRYLSGLSLLCKNFRK